MSQKENITTQRSYFNVLSGYFFLTILTKLLSLTSTVLYGLFSGRGSNRLLQLDSLQVLQTMLEIYTN